MNEFAKDILNSAFSYLGEKAADKGIDVATRVNYKTALHDYMAKATETLCRQFNLTMPEEAPEMVCQKPPKSLSNEDTEVCLSEALGGQEILSDHVDFWKDTVYTAIADNAGLYRYLSMKYQDMNKAEDPKDKVQDVIEQYAENYTKPLFLHEDRNDKVNLTNLYVPPRMKYRGDECRGFEPVLSSFLRNKHSKILFVEGDAAVGKTSLVSQLCYQYQYGDRSIFQDRPLVCVRLRDLDVSVRHKDDTKYLLSYLEIKSEKDFSQQYKNAVVVLDGADELVMVEGKQLQMDVAEFFLNLQDSFRDCKWVITGRPQYVNKEKMKREVPMSEAAILHFNSKKRQEWADAYCQKCEETLSMETERFIRTMTDEDASGVADTPLALYLLAQSKAGENYKDNPWLLYHEIFSSALYETKYNKNVALNRKSRKHWIKNYSEGIYHFIGQIAFQMFQNENDEVITSEQLDELMKQEETSPDIVALAAENEEKDWLKTLCAICGYWKETGRGALEFYHNNIRDFFFCEYIYDRVRDCLQLENKEEPISAEKFIETVAELFPHRPLASKDDDRTTWEQTFLFLFHRLSYEYTQKEEKSLCEIVITEGYNPLPDVLYAMVGGNTLLPALGAKGYTIPLLKQIENIYLNTLFLSRIWQEVFRINGEIKKIKIWNHKEKTKKKMWDDILVSLSHLLSYRISGKTTVVSVGSWASLGRSRLEGSHLSNAFLKGANLERANLERANLERANLYGAHLERTHFEGAHLNDANLEGANLEGAYLEGVYLVGAHLNRTNFAESHLGEGHLEGVNLERANLEGAYLAGAHLEGAHLEGTFLVGAHLVDAYLERAYLEKAHLEGARLEGAYFERARLEGAYLENSIGLRYSKGLEYAHNLDKAYLPLNCHVKKLTKDFFGPGPYYEITWDD